MSTFSPIEIGKRLKCPWCGSKTLTTPESRKTAQCNNCQRVFRIMILDKPDPNLNPTFCKKHCGRKIKHVTINSAYEHCIEILPKDLPGRTSKTLCIYLCTLCNLWHVGHKSKRKKYLYSKTYTFIELREIISKQVTGVL